MIADFVIDDIEQLERETGRHVSPRDVIRLNAVGLKVKAAQNKHATSCLGYLPRVAQIAPGLFFRQPAIGHEIWMERIEQIAAEEFETVLAIRAFALSRSPADLPDPLDVDAVKLAIDDFAVRFRDYTRDQILAALEYVVRGANPCRGEIPSLADEAPGSERLPDGTEGEDWKECIAIGSLRDAQAVLWGVNQKELESMTRQQVERLTAEAYYYHGIETKPHDFLTEYQVVLDEIREKLSKPDTPNPGNSQNLTL